MSCEKKNPKPKIYYYISNEKPNDDYESNFKYIKAKGVHIGFTWK